MFRIKNLLEICKMEKFTSFLVARKSLEINEEFCPILFMLHFPKNICSRLYRPVEAFVDFQNTEKIQK